MIINLYFDNKYYDWVKPLAESISIHEPKAKIYYHTFNLSNKQVNNIKSFSNTIYIDNKKMKFDIKISDEYILNLNENNPLRFQITCRKGEFMLSSMKRFPDEDLFIIMDVDMLMINSLKKLKYQMKNYDVGIIRVCLGKIMGTFLTAKPTESGKHFLKNFNKQVMNGRLYLCKDQKTLDKVYVETKENIKFLLLNRKYIDHTLGINSYIWSAHKEYLYGGKNKRLKLFKYISQNLHNKHKWKEYLKNWILINLDRMEKRRKEEEQESKRKKKERMKALLKEQEKESKKRKQKDKKEKLLEEEARKKARHEDLRKIKK